MLARELTPKRWPLPAVESTSVIVTLRAFAGEVAMEGRGPERGPAPGRPGLLYYYVVLHRTSAVGYVLNGCSRLLAKVVPCRSIQLVANSFDSDSYGRFFAFCLSPLKRR